MSKTDRRIDGLLRGLRGGPRPSGARDKVYNQGWDEGCAIRRDLVESIEASLRAAGVVYAIARRGDGPTPAERRSVTEALYEDAREQYRLPPELPDDRVSYLVTFAGPGNALAFGRVVDHSERDRPEEEIGRIGLLSASLDPTRWTVEKVEPEKRADDFPRPEDTPADAAALAEREALDPGADDDGPPERAPEYHDPDSPGP